MVPVAAVDGVGAVDDPVPPVGNHLYLNGPTPLVTFTEAAPSLPPLQLTGVREASVIVEAPTFEIVVTSETVQPFESSTVTV